MKPIVVNRRQVLRGAGGVSLALPFLPSLFPRRADGAELIAGLRPSFVAMTTVHGAVLPENMYPAAASLVDSTNVYTGYTVKSGPLPSAGQKLSNALTAAALTPRLISKMNVLRGFDYPYYIGHHSGGHLGNYVRSDQGPKNMAAFATIDQIMAYSPSVYPDLTGVKQRSMVTGKGGFGGGPSFAYANPTAKSGAVNNLTPDNNAAGMFTKLFSGGAPVPIGMPVARRPTIAGRIAANYQSLRQSNRRLSVDDRARLDAHVTLLAELERTLKVSGGSNAVSPQCGSVKAPGSGYQGMNDVIAFAFACGVSRVATISLPSAEFASIPHGPWHQDVAHNANAGNNQQLLTNCAKSTFENVFVDLMKKLDALEIAPGVTALDTSLLQWTFESGWNTHDAQDMPIIMAGSANGFFKTGLFVDYRSTKRMRMFGSLQQQQLGLPHRQWLATALQAMHVMPAEFEKGGKPGYGDPLSSADYDAAVIPQVAQNASKPVPVIT